ncbi:MAG: translation initiation factor IF-2 [Candidatus Marinimicrobia bacterium]|nr:translation initiation factor IF-2 [Candidatus Neomarinimicrobiota bacterium]|tara:strand:+ start:2011 stop:4293 length:2283 start_codon:yes stop_codon:yes gene_type:complete
MKEKRIYQISKELNISHHEIMKFVENNGFKVSNHMMPVSNEVYSLILTEFSKEKTQVERVQKEKARQAIVTNNQIKQASADAELKEDKPKNKNVKLDLKESIRKSKEKLQSELKNKEIIAETNLKKVDISKITENKSTKSRGPAKKINIAESLSKLNKKSKKKIKKKVEDENIEDSLEVKTIKVPEFLTVDELSKMMKLPAQDIIMQCMDLGLMVTINQRLDMEIISMIANEFGFEIETIDIFKEDIEQEVIDESLMEDRPPVVTVMGHVDHGKTSLLDYIRETNVIAGESGGITQHVGAYEVDVKDKKITFIDTPGHEAFTAMRARGAQVTDIVILIVAADDGLMPQTIEAIDHAKAASVPMIIAINKIDKPGSNPDNIKKQLSEKNILVEDWGGKIQCAHISAKMGTGIDDLLDKILLEAEVLTLKAPKECLAKGMVLESRLDKGLGPVGTVIIQQGTLKKGQIFVCGSQYSKVRDLLNERGESVSMALPSDPVQILGFEKVPVSGESFIIYNEERDAKKISLERSRLEREAIHQMHSKITLDQISEEIKSGKASELNILIKGDVDGSIEALSDSLMNLSNNEVRVNIILKSVGMVSQTDVRLASASKAIIICFNVSSSVIARKLSRELGVDIKHYSIIYEAIEEIRLALEGLLKPDIIEESVGSAEVRDIFKIPKIGMIAGCHISKGKVIRNSKLRLLREGEIIYEGHLTSLKRFKDDANEVLEGFECGIGIDNFKEFEVNDVIEVYENKEVKRKLK